MWDDIFTIRNQCGFIVIHFGRLGEEGDLYHTTIMGHSIGKKGEFCHPTIGGAEDGFNIPRP